jgi:hypothetical protein
MSRSRGGSSASAVLSVTYPKEKLSVLEELLAWYWFVR